ncbi:type IV toxin-antitoxin system AbiEi family antitoxin domain-containing protein [Mycobacterium kubicae]|uniref:type IV toxin-antitoxin system AbiEi family antitoxin domain-containing protein n=1 Tax=Mycobacterium kubicae TaxID=120959 RepID=UPI00163FDC3D|nr:type IV toxin-antitoxin system AbiEi family antitoxin domain-containing protein [Mycobacterium kubicae]QNI06503.1 type IV toxin-antitoxin system AbiEi family antitoxin domain-containing protein [Mycobacterium kubicae]
MFAELSSVPRLLGALCRGKATVFDALDDERTAEAAALCQLCPALVPCSAWVASLPRGSFVGVVAGSMHELNADVPDVNPADREPSTVTGRIEAFVAGRRETRPADLAMIGIDRHQACALLARLAKSGRVRRIGRGLYSGTTGNQSGGPYFCGRPTARKRPCRNEVAAAGQACEYHHGKERPMPEPDDRDDEEGLVTFLEVTASPDPGDLGQDEPKLQPLCRECVRELPDGDDGLCAFCRVVTGP